MGWGERDVETAMCIGMVFGAYDWVFLVCEMMWYDCGLDIDRR